MKPGAGSSSSPPSASSSFLSSTGQSGVSRRPSAMSREALERSCWDWVDEIEDVEEEVNEDEVYMAYKLFFPAHVFPDFNCKRNCK